MGRHQTWPHPFLPLYIPLSIPPSYHHCLHSSHHPYLTSPVALSLSFPPYLVLHSLLYSNFSPIKNTSIYHFFSRLKTLPSFPSPPLPRHFSSHSQIFLSILLFFPTSVFIHSSSSLPPSSSSSVQLVGPFH